ncbi:MAG: glycosyltransferase, partial [Streptococcaceae bacterium]|nr:glycosyltransferase [Streptococcaceae bacterium]
MRIDQPFFSVVIPIYNVEDFLQEALLSIENQTYKNIELVLIDDGSSDLSWKLIEDFQKTSRLKVSFIFQENKGLSAVRNRGIKEASGEYVYFLDSDDAVQSDLFEKIAERIMKDELEVIFFDGEVFVEEGVESPYKEDFYRHKVMDVTQAYSTEEYYGLGKVLPNVPLYVMKKDLLLENAISFEEGIYHEDEVFTPKVLRAAERIGAVEGIFYKRRWRPGSIMSTTSLSHLQKRIQSQKKVVELLEEFLDRNKAEIQENERGFLEGKIRYFQDVAVKNEEKMELELQNMKENERDLPKVSIIIPVYNVEDFLDETLGSVASQTYTAIELILVDDGSTDGSQQVMQDFKKGHEDDFDIRILYQENQGQSAARNYGVAESTGDYIYFLDSDDFIDPETIEVLVERSLKDDLDLVLFQAIPFKEEGVVLARPLEVYENYYQYKKMS